MRLGMRIGETASAVARRLFAKNARSLFTRRRRENASAQNAFSDAWFDGAAALEGVEARRADFSSEFLLGLERVNSFLFLTQRFTDVAERWPWDVIVAAHAEEGI